METIEFKVCDKDTGEIVGYEFFNTNQNIGYFCLDMSELTDGKMVGDLICHSDPTTLKPKDPMGSLVRYSYTGYTDKNAKKIYKGDQVISTYFPNTPYSVTDLIVAHWLIATDRCESPTKQIKLVEIF